MFLGDFVETIFFYYVGASGGFGPPHLVQEKDTKIANLEREVRDLADANDSLEQYTRRPNLRFESIRESDHGEDTKGVTMHRCIDASRYLGRRYVYRIVTQVSRY